MKERFKGLSLAILIFAIGVALIAVYKTFDNISNIFAFVGRIFNILSPFVIGLGLAFLLFAPSIRLEHWFKKQKGSWISRHARPLSVLAVYLVFFALIALLLVFALPAIIQAAVGFATALPDYYKRLKDYLGTFSKDGGLLQGFDVASTVDKLYTKYIGPKLTTDAVLGYFTNIMSFTASLLNIFMAVIISIYMLLGRESLLHAGRQLLSLILPEKWIAGLASYTHRSCVILYSYLYSQVLDAFIVGVIMTIGMFIFHAPNAPVLGFMIGLMNMIPYFGAIIGGCIAVIITLLSGNFYGAVLVAVYIICMQQVDGNLIQPRIVGNTIGVKPVYVLLAITLGGGLFGFWGIFFAVPTIAIIQMILRDYIHYRDRLKKTPKPPVV